MDLDKILKPLEDLYTVTKLDWDLSIHHSLTEPTCPTIIIKPEGSTITRYQAHCDPNKFEESLQGLVNLVVAEIIEGKLIGRANTPFTNSDDNILETWLTQRQKEPDIVFPYQYFHDRMNEEFRKQYGSEEDN